MEVGERFHAGNPGGRAGDGSVQKRPGTGAGTCRGHGRERGGRTMFPVMAIEVPRRTPLGAPRPASSPEARHVPAAGPAAEAKQVPATQPAEWVAELRRGTRYAWV